MNENGKDLLDRSLQFWITISKFYLELKEKNIMKLRIRFLEVGQVLVQILEKLKLPKVNKISFINLQ